eukprot:TRINITY_DN4858_c0_g1_i3.p1 TRINITY_DN4858_c0_g1~~TRINITY_DN4858_c0_g1_i3.p1  ORF type:complete len:129 (+),score=24.13 TRINITY_DN4858_c0_g1_i3:53-439(+)
MQADHPGRRSQMSELEVKTTRTLGTFFCLAPLFAHCTKPLRLHNMAHDGVVRWKHDGKKYACAPSQQLKEFPGFTVLDSEDNEPYVSLAFQEGSLLTAAPQESSEIKNLKRRCTELEQEVKVEYQWKF